MESETVHYDEQHAVPRWAALVRENSGWTWNGSTLCEEPSVAGSHTAPAKESFAGLVIKYVYGRQNRCRSVRRMIAGAVSRLGMDQFGLNFGSGKLRLAPNILNLELGNGPDVDLASAGSLMLPLKSESLHLIVTQEVLEHVDRPFDAILEFHRVLSSEGELLLQLPFVIGYHPGPTDFWRFTKEAYAKLLPPEEWHIEEKCITVGHGSALHRILTEFIAIHFSVFGGRVYRVAKGACAVLLYPLIMFDALLPFLPEKDRIPGGYIVRARPIKKIRRTLELNLAKDFEIG